MLAFSPAFNFIKKAGILSITFLFAKRLIFQMLEPFF
jgi:hypothetical protein